MCVLLALSCNFVQNSLAQSSNLPENQQQAAKARIPVVGLGETQLEYLGAIQCNPRQKKLYVGVLVRDAARRGLLVYDLGVDGQPLGHPRRYSQHPDELPSGHHSSIVCFCLDEQHPKLFFGVHGSHPTQQKTLVMYQLNAEGEPIGNPEAFDHGNVNKSCDAISVHPRTGQLVAVGWGGEGLFVLNRNQSGSPIGTGRFERTSGYGGVAVAIRPDGTKAYRGTYPSTIEVSDLTPECTVIGTARLQKIPGGKMEYTRFVATTQALYFRGPDGRLAWYRLDSQGEIQGDLKTWNSPHLQALAVGRRSDSLLVAIGTTFRDPLSGQDILDGTEIQEWQTDADGTPQTLLNTSGKLLRTEAISLSGGRGPALAAKSMGRGFLGNRLSGLQLRCTLLSLDQSGAAFPNVKTVKLGEEQSYLRFVVSEKHSMVFCVTEEKLVTYRLDATAATAMDSRSCRSGTGPLVLDEKRGLLYGARKDGSLFVWRLDSQGQPVGDPTPLKTAATAISALVLNPHSGLVYVLGEQSANLRDDSPAVTISAGTHAADAVLDIDRGRLYVVGAYRGNENLSIWKLNAEGRLISSDPTWYADGLPATETPRRGVLSTIRLDSRRRKLYLGGAPENAPEGNLGSVIMYDLDEQGDIQGAPRHLSSQNKRSSVWALETTADGRWLYEAGWGEPQVFLRSIDANGQPSSESTAWTIGYYGKRQITVTSDGRFLLCGTYPSTLEIVNLNAPDKPEAGALVDLSAEGFQRKLGMLGPNQPSDWIGLDDVLKNGIGSAVLRCTLTGTRVRRAVIRWEVAQKIGDSASIVRAVDLPISGNVGALTVPKYGLDDIVGLDTRIQTSAEEFKRYLDIAKKYGLKPEERPQKFIVANGLIGLDSSPEALEYGAETLALLGHNTVQAWSWGGLNPENLRSTLARHGFHNFRDAVYNPPSYFHYNEDLVKPAFLEKWAAGFRDSAVQLGARPEELKLLHMGDEPGWYYPASMNDVQNHPGRLEVFRQYLRSKNLRPEELGAKSWEQIVPGRPSLTRTLADRKRLYWTARFFTESLSLSFAAATRALQKEVNPQILTTANLNNWPGRYFIASPGEKIANNSDVGPDAAMGMPDWFDLGRKKAITCIWTEDWFGDADSQNWSLYGDLLRCAAREGQIEYGGYPVGQSTGAFPGGSTYKILSLVGHGAKVIDPYIFGPNLAFADGWSDKEVSYRNLAAAMKLLAKGERLLAPGRPRNGTAAILFPQASQVWDPAPRVNCYLQEIYGLHSALTHLNYPVDFIDDFGVENRDFDQRQYAVIYVTAPNLSRKAQQALLTWAKAGGTLVLTPGACAADEYNDPTDILVSHSGVAPSPVTRVAPPHHTQALRLEQTAIELLDKSFGFTKSFSTVQAIPLQIIDARKIGQFSGGAAAMTEIAIEKGRIITLGFWPGVTYWLSPDRTDLARLPTGWSESVRSIIGYPLARSPKARHVRVSVPGVEACLLESPQGMAITLLNWSGQAIENLRVEVPHAGRFRNAQSARLGPVTAINEQETFSCTLPLETVDVILLDPKSRD